MTDFNSPHPLMHIGPRESWLKHYREKPDYYTARYVPDLKEQPLPDLLSADELSRIVGNRDYADYLADFSFRHPVMWFLFYRWWFLLAMPKELRAPLIRLVRSRTQNKSYIRPYRWQVVLLHNPVLFLVWIVLFSGFKFLVKFLTSSSRVIRVFRRRA